MTSFAEMAAAGRRAARSMELEAQRSTLEGSSNNLDDMISDIEERAAEATNPEQSVEAAPGVSDAAAPTSSTASDNGQSNKGQKASSTEENIPESATAADPTSTAEQAAPQQTQVDIVV